MGCLLGCFGVSTKRKRRKSANRILPGPPHSKYVSYEPLDSSVNVDDNPDDSIVSKSQLSNKPEERLSVKIRKKVSFNLNVQSYEPIPDEETTTTYRFLQSVEDEEEREKDGGEDGKGRLPFLSDGVSSSLQMSSYPCNYRYQNCRESFEEEDEFVYEESDLEDDDDDDDEFGSLNMDSTKGDSLIQLDEVCGSNARIRCSSVLNPIENTTQWKEIKARAALKPRQMRKENVAVEEESQISFGLNPNFNQSKPSLQDIAVDTSLSNWLISPDINKSEVIGRTKSCSIAFDALQSKKSISDNDTFSRSREGRVILDITNL